MNAKILIPALLLGALSAACHTLDKDESRAAVDAEAMGKAWLEYGTPGPAHQKFAYKAGHWTVNTKHMMTNPPTLAVYTSEIKSVLDGRFVSESMQGEMMGMPFQGLGMTGYDNLKKAYFVTWVDNWGTGVTYLQGRYDAEAHSFVYDGLMADPLAGGSAKCRFIEHKLDDDHWTMQMYMTHDGKLMLDMEANYTRMK